MWNYLCIYVLCVTLKIVYFKLCYNLMSSLLTLSREAFNYYYFFFLYNWFFNYWNYWCTTSRRMCRLISERTDAMIIYILLGTDNECFLSVKRQCQRHVAWYRQTFRRPNRISSMQKTVWDFNERIIS